MPSPARAAARARAAELLPGKLTHPAWPSWLEVFVIALGWLEQLKMERRRKSTVVLYNVIEEILNRGRWLLDDRHAWEIASELGLTRKWVRESLCALERDEVVFRLHMVGHSSKHGLTSNVLVFPQLLVLCLDLIPRGARAATIQFLRRADVRAQLEAGGVWARLPEAVTGVALTVRPTSGITGTVPADTASQGSTIVSSVGDRRSRSPTPRAVDDVDESAEGAVAPIPHIAPSAASTVPEGPPPPPPPPPPAPPAAGERQSGPRLVSPSPATLVSAPRPPAVPPATHGPRAAGSRSEARPTLPEHLRGLHVPERQVLDWLVEHNPGMSRGKAWDRIKGYRQSARWRLQRDARGEASGRPRAQGRREAKAVAAKAVAANLDGDRQWAMAHRAWTDAAGDAEFFGWIMALRCAGWAMQEGALVVRVTGPTDVLNRIAFRRAWLEDRAEAALGVPVVISWEPS
jgi:hypothetical protein